MKLMSSARTFSAAMIRSPSFSRSSSSRITTMRPARISSRISGIVLKGMDGVSVCGFPSPFGRRCPAGADEGSGEAKRHASLAPSPQSLPQRERGFMSGKAVFLEEIHVDAGRLATADQPFDIARDHVHLDVHRVARVLRMERGVLHGVRYQVHAEARAGDFVDGEAGAVDAHRTLGGDIAREAG